MNALEHRTVEVRGTTLAYREVGRGEPVVLVHGGASDLRTWEQQLPAVGASRRAIAYSRRYARPNPPIDPDADDPMIPHVDDLVALLRATDAAPAHLVGHSWGGFVCLLTAIRHPELVRTLVLEEPPVLTLFVSQPAPRPTELLGLLLRRPRTALAIVRFGAGTIAPARKAFRRGDDEAALEVYGRGVLGAAAFARLSPQRRQQVRDNLATDRAQLLGAGFPPLADADVRAVRAPVLLLTGEHSPALFCRLTDRLEELLPDARRVEIAAAAHLLHEQNPFAYNAAVLDFLAGPVAPPPRGT